MSISSLDFSIFPLVGSWRHYPFSFQLPLGFQLIHCTAPREMELCLPRAVYSPERSTGWSTRSPAGRTGQERELSKSNLPSLASKAQRAAEPRLYIREGSDKSKHLTQPALAGQMDVLLPTLFLGGCLRGQSGSKRNTQSKAKDFHINSQRKRALIFP